MPDHYPQPHCNSYYAATANVTTDYPQLGGASSCDVCIIGAGFTGISAALHLAERGYKVSVLESNRVSWGASGRNGGQLIGGISSGHGVNVTHLAGQVVADAIAGTYERFDVFEKVKHYRIPGGQWVGNQLLALGMIYFRLLDLL